MQRCLRLFVYLSAFFLLLWGSAYSLAAVQSVWVPKVDSLETWQQLSKHERDAEFSKFFLDVKTGRMYFVDANVFPLHIDFGLSVLLKQSRTPDSVKNFNRNYGANKPQFIMGYLTHYPKLDLWTFSFWEGDAIGRNDVMKTYYALRKTFFANLSFRPDSLRQEQMAESLKVTNIPVVYNDKIYQDLPFVAFNTGKALGTLRIVPPESQIEDMNFETTDIVLLQAAYPDISPVAGIITTQFSTPLAHVNLRASAWGIPNASLKSAAQDFASLDNQIVSYQVSEQGLVLQAASDEEVALFKAQVQEEKNVLLPTVDLNEREFKPLQRIQAKDAVRYGAKTANLGQIASRNLKNVYVPSGFGVPFYYYTEHIKANHLQPLIDEMLNDPRFKNDAKWRREQLEHLQKAIIAAPISKNMMEGVTDNWQRYLKGVGVFVRSSTNAEDLKGFNGAGLYDSVPNVKTNAALEEAIKKVWASVWNERAVNERSFVGIDHRQVYPAVLIQTGVNATAAGVLLTTDIWGHNPNTYFINAKWGLGMRVVEGQKVPEQVLYDANNHGTRIISRSSESTMLVFDEENGVREIPTPAGNTILTEARARRLGDAVGAIIPLFSKETPLDVEWVLDGEKIWIVQARPYVGNASKQ